MSLLLALDDPVSLRGAPLAAGGGPVGLHGHRAGRTFLGRDRRCGRRRTVADASHVARRPESAEFHPLRAATLMGGSGIPRQHGSDTDFSGALG